MTRKPVTTVLTKKRCSKGHLMVVRTNGRTRCRECDKNYHRDKYNWKKAIEGLKQ